MHSKPEARLENWALIMDSYSPYQAPETIGSRLTGTVYDHNHEANPLPDGLTVTTSRLVTVDFKARVAETRNTIYKLGVPDPKWIEFLKASGSDLKKYGLVDTVLENLPVELL